MIIMLVRSGFVDCYTLGILIVDGIFFCNTLENMDRHLEDDPDAKIPGETAIPRGRYPVDIRYCAHVGRDLPILDAVAGFGTASVVDRGYDFEGEIIIGRQSHNRWINLDWRILDVLAEMIERASKREEVWLTIS